MEGSEKVLIALPCLVGDLEDGSQFQYEINLTQEFSPTQIGKT
jgi:hypothetical protein